MAKHLHKLSRSDISGLKFDSAGSYLSGLTPHARSIVLSIAKRRGLTVEGLLSNAPGPLKEQSLAGIRKRALATVNAAYAPAEAQLSDREQQINNLDAKRKLDNQFYSNWLNDQLAKANANAQASEAALLQQAGQMHDAVTQRYTQAQSALDAQNAATPGTVSNPTQSTANLAPSQDKATSAADVANAAAVGQVARQQTNSATLNAANLAMAGAMEAKRQGDTYSALTDVSGKRHSLLLQKGADISKEISRELDNEVSKAQGLMNFGALQQKLGLQQATLNEHAAHDRSTSRNANARLNHQIAKDRHSQMLADKTYQLNVKKFGLAQAKQQWQEAHPRGSTTGGAGGLTVGERHNSQKLINTMENAIGAIHTGGLSQQNAHLILTSPQKAATQNSAGNPYGGYDSLVAQGAVEVVYSPDHRLSPRTYRALRAIGMVVPTRWKPKKSGAQLEPRT